MKITIVGSGYVGLVSGACFAEMGNDVWCIDIDKTKIENLKKGIIPIYEPGLKEMIENNAADGRLKFSTDIADGLKESLYIFIAVGTPQDEDGSADLQHVLAVAKDIGEKAENYVIVIDKSTVPVGTAARVKETIQAALNKRGAKNIEFDVVSNPEFLKEGDAINDFMKPDRIVVGVDNVRTAELMKELYQPFVRNGHPIFVMDILSAEVTKYAANAMLATRISFMNELAKLCDITGADIEMIRDGIGSDSRIGMPFLFAGIGYGGSCFPKDVKAIIQTFKENGLQAKILEAVDQTNKEKRIIFAEKVINYYKGDVKKKTFAVWGLSFKPQTDDMREAPAVEIINTLKNAGAHIKAYDPIAIDNARRILGDENIEYVSDEYSALENADALLILTEWHQFRRPDFEKIKSLMKNSIIFDGRNLFEPKRIKDKGFVYLSIGRQ